MFRLFYNRNRLIFALVISPLKDITLALSRRTHNIRVYLTILNPRLVRSVPQALVLSDKLSVSLELVYRKIVPQLLVLTIMTTRGI